MTRYPLSIKSYGPGLTVIIPGIQICSEKKSEASIAGGLAPGSGSDDRRHPPVSSVSSVSPLVPGPGLLHQSLLHHQAAQAAHSMQGNILERRIEHYIPSTIGMSTGDPPNPLFTISGLYPPFTSPLMSRAKPFESPASAASGGLFPGLGSVPGLPGLPPHHLSPLLSSHLGAHHQGHFPLPHPFFPATSASTGGPGGQKSPILARGAGGHTGKL